MRYQLEKQEDQKNGRGQQSSKSVNDPDLPTFNEEVRALGLRQRANREPDPIRPNQGDGDTSANILIPKAAPEGRSVPGRQRGTGRGPNPETPDSDILKALTR